MPIIMEIERDFHGRRLPPVAGASALGHRSLFGSAVSGTSGLEQSGDVIRPLPSQSSSTTTTIVYRSLADVIASQVTNNNHNLLRYPQPLLQPQQQLVHHHHRQLNGSNQCIPALLPISEATGSLPTLDIESFHLFDSRLMSPRHSPIESAAPHPPASGLPNFRTLIDDLHLGSSAGSSSAPAGNTAFECGLVGGSSEWPRLTSMLTPPDELPHHLHQLPTHYDRRVLPSEEDDGDLYLNIPSSSIRSAMAVSAAQASSFGGPPPEASSDGRVADDDDRSASDSDGFLHVETLPELWGLGARLFDVGVPGSSGCGISGYDDVGDMSINSTPEQEGIRKIQQTSARLNISPEPLNWSVQDVCKWLRATVRRLYGSTSSPQFCPEDWPYTGPELCRLGIHEFEARLGSDADFIMAELEQWKHMGSIASAGSDLSAILSPSGALTTYTGRDAISEMNYTTLESAAHINQEHYLYALNNDNNNNNCTSRNSPRSNCTLTQCISSSHRRPAISPDPSPRSSHAQHPHHHHHQQSQSLSSFSNSTKGGDVPLAAMTSSAWAESPYLAVSGSSNGALSAVPSSYIKTEMTSSYNPGNMSILTPVDENRSSTDDSLLYCAAAHYVNDDVELQQGCYKWSESSVTSSSANFRSTGQHHHHSRSSRGTAKRTICLWQFLRELLLMPQSYQSWIRWVDRNKGIFKIEDSVRVAKLWGERKNRPAMNYDKLSRSIRQYYKKGIIQKTSNSKRLVYQFCPEYML